MAGPTLVTFSGYLEVSTPDNSVKFGSDQDYMFSFVLISATYMYGKDVCMVKPGRIAS